MNQQMVKQSSAAWRTVQIARHPERPLFLDYVNTLFTEFDALHGDRLYGDDGALIGGLARFDGQPVMVVGQHLWIQINFNCGTMPRDTYYAIHKS